MCVCVCAFVRNRNSLNDSFPYVSVCESRSARGTRLLSGAGPSLTNRDGFSGL